jgi:hypothetical protein
MTSTLVARVRSPIGAVVAALVAFLLLAAILGRTGSDAPAVAAPPPGQDPAALQAAPASYVVVSRPPIARRPQLPGGGYRIFGHHRFLVAYYGTAHTSSLGVLGATDPDTAARRVVRAGRPFLRGNERLQPVFELIATVADGGPGADGDYSHDIPRSYVEEYIRAAHRHHALLLLDLQTGRSAFPVVAKRWAWALRDPSVGLALDPEWRMGPHQVPGHVIGTVRAREVDQTSAWLSHLVRSNGLPQKLFVVHQFRLSMLPDIGRIVGRPGLAMVQQEDGFGTQAEKLATYHAVARPKQFYEGFKLFYKVDVHRFTPAQVRRIRPAVSFVSYQ